MTLTVRPEDLKTISSEIEEIEKILKHYERTLPEAEAGLKGMDDSYDAIRAAIRRADAKLSSEMTAIRLASSTLMEIAELYGNTENEINDFRRFPRIPEDKRTEVTGWKKKIFLNDTDHTIELVDPEYFDKYIKDHVEDIDELSVGKDFLDALYQTATHGEGMDDAQTKFTLTVQMLLQYKYMDDVLKYFDEAAGMDDTLTQLNVPPQYLAYGVLIDGEPFIDYVMEHPEVLYDDTTPLAQRDRNRADQRYQEAMKKFWRK